MKRAPRSPLYQKLPVADYAEPTANRPPLCARCANDYGAYLGMGRWADYCEACQRLLREAATRGDRPLFQTRPSPSRMDSYTEDDTHKWEEET